MKPEDRRRRVAAMVEQQGRSSVEALAEQFGVSTETIRRDLALLSVGGALQKIHGGARAVRLHAESSFEIRMAEDAIAKQVIAQKIAALIEPGETLFMDTGTTTLACAEAMTAIAGITVITNSAHIARAIGRNSGARVLFLGGTYGFGNAQTTGAETVREIARFRTHRAILTPAAVDPEGGILDSDLDEANVARAMHEFAHSTVVVAASSKFYRKAAFQVCPLAEIDLLVTDDNPSPELVAVCTAGGVALQ